MTHPSESGRFYYPDGKPAYEVPSADGKKMITPDIRHAKKLGLLPSVTTIIQEAARPGLERWKVTQGILSALTLPRLPDESLDAFADRAMQDSKEQARKAAERGTAIHAAIQGYYEGEGFPLEYREYTEAVAVLLHKFTADAPEFQWTAEQSFSGMGYGGKCDLHNPVDLGLVLDIKTKEFADTDKKLAWDEHCIQLAAYRVGLGISKATCANVFVSVNNPGLVHIHEWSEAELQRGWEMFQALLSYFYARTGLTRAS